MDARVAEGGGWIAVLPRDVPEPALTALAAGCRGRGWSADASRGAEQTVVVVAGPRAAAELDGLLGSLSPGLEADLEPLREAEDYRRRRSLRRFLTLLGWGLGLFSAAILVAPLLDYLRPLADGSGTAEAVPVNAARELGVGEARVVRAGDEPVLVVRSSAGIWHALSAWCTHGEGCTLEWDADRRELSCPCHGCAFDPRGNVLRPPALFPLAARKLRVLAGQVSIAREQS